MAGKKTWTEEQDDFLRENYVKLGPLKCAEILGKPYHGTQARANKKLGLRQYKHIKWTEEEIQFLRANYPDKLGHYCAERLGRSFYAVHKMVEQLGITPKWTYRYVDAFGYVVLCHDRENRVHEHRFVMEQKLGRKLTSDDIVHHIDGNKQNNEPDNLVLTTRAEHIETHREDLLQAQRLNGNYKR